MAERCHATPGTAQARDWQQVMPNHIKAFYVDQLLELVFEAIREGWTYFDLPREQYEQIAGMKAMNGKAIVAAVYYPRYMRGTLTLGGVNIYCPELRQLQPGAKGTQYAKWDG